MLEHNHPPAHQPHTWQEWTKATRAQDGDGDGGGEEGEKEKTK